MSKIKGKCENCNGYVRDFKYYKYGKWRIVRDWCWILGFKVKPDGEMCNNPSPRKHQSTLDKFK